MESVFEMTLTSVLSGTSHSNPFGIGLLIFTKLTLLSLKAWVLTTNSDDITSADLLMLMVSPPVQPLLSVTFTQ